MKLKRYAVTVMDNWTPWRTFWTLRGAQRFQQRHPGYAFLYEWKAHPGTKYFGWAAISEPNS